MSLKFAKIYQNTVFSTIRSIITVIFYCRLKKRIQSSETFLTFGTNPEKLYEFIEIST